MSVTGRHVAKRLQAASLATARAEGYAAGFEAGAVAPGLYTERGRKALSELRAKDTAAAHAEGYAQGVEAAREAARSVFAHWSRPEYGLRLKSDVDYAIRALVKP